jgi:seryl-tRNA synthetase
MAGDGGVWTTAAMGLPAAIWLALAAGARHKAPQIQIRPALMHDIKWIRDNPAAFDAGLEARGLPSQAHDLIALDERLRAAMTRRQEAEARRNQASRAIGAAKARGDDTEAQRLMREVERAKQDIEAAANEEPALQGALQDVLERLPNLPAPDVPRGHDETANIELKRWGEPRTGTPAKPHFELGEALGLLDFETAAKISGARFVILKGWLARLERALAQFMLDVQTQENGYTEIQPPYLVRSHAAYGTSNLPKSSEDMFRTTDDFWLIPTAEVPVTNMVRESILDAAQLPLRYAAYTPCFRSEAGSAGRDTRGMIRMHQFNKVELVSITTPEQSDAEHERMTSAAELVLQRLNLPYRRMLLCSGDMGFAARKTFDLEVWLPGEGKYREISSCSNCGEFQARRMAARFRSETERKPRLVHTLNGSGLAVGRTLIAVMENYQNEDGSITVPDALIGYMGGRRVIERS